MSDLVQTEEFLLRQEVALLEAELALKEGLPHLHGMPWYEWAWDFFTTENRMAFLCAANQISKDLDVSTEIPTPNGFKRMGDLRVGDFVFAQDGTKTKVVEIPYEGSGPGYRLIFSDGSSVIAGPNHAWICKTYKERFRKRYTRNKRSISDVPFENIDYGKWIELTTEQIIQVGGYDPQAKDNGRKVSIPVSEPVEHESKILFDPYLLGLLLGDGCFRGTTYTITSKDQEIVDYIESFGGKRTGQTITWRLPVSVRDAIRELGLGDCLSNSKFIPKQYFEASVSQRLKLLRGLMDTDGTCSEKTKHVSFTTVSQRLAEDVRTLVCSLGGTVKTKKRKSGYRHRDGSFVRCQDAYCLSIKIKLNPFKLSRKDKRHCGEVRYKHERIIERIEPIGKIESRCITVAHPSGTFLATRDYIVTHNSSTQIRKCIDWATDTDKWPRLWPTPGLPSPNLFWYLYPVAANATTEFQTKWMQFLPKGKYKESKKYGWREEYKNKEIHAIHFNSGVTVQFKSYKQGGFALQSSTVYAIFLDEESPIELWDEFVQRVNATDGYISMVFTATLGQEEWRQVIEPGADEEEKFPQAWKRQISVYDCMKYMDGTAGPWSEQRINDAIARCSTQAQVQRRILGKFVKESGLIYEQFDPKRHMKEWHPVPQSWLWYVAADIGSGSVSKTGQGHPGAIVVLAVKPDRTTGRVVYCWRGDNMRTTAGDIYNKAEEIVKELDIQPVAKLYDHACADFGIIAMRNGGGWRPANKSQTAGEDMVNTLFKNDMLFIYSRGQNGKLASELCSVNHETVKRKRRDDIADCLRSVCMDVGWDWRVIQGIRPDKGGTEEMERGLTPEQRELRARRGEADEWARQEAEHSAEFAEINEMYEGYF